MKYKLSIQKSIFKLKKYLIIYLILFDSFSKSDIVFPDHYVKNDLTFQENEIISTAKIKQVYHAGYFTIKNDIIYSYKYGIYYYPDKTCENVINYFNRVLSNPFFSNNFIRNTDSTEKPNSIPNISEETELYSNYMEGKNIICDAQFTSIHNSNYILYYKIAIISNSLIEINLISQTNPNTLKICSKTITDYHIFRIKIRSILLSTANHIRMYFKCDDENEVNMEITGEETFKIQFNSNNVIYLSNYLISIIDISLNPYGTKNGLLDNINPNCIPQFYKSGTKCEKCHYLCYKCSSSLTTCDKCNILSEYNNNINNCKINYINFQNFQDFNFEIGPPETHRITFGYWVYISNPENISNLSNNIFHIVLGDLIISTININRDTVDNYCHVFENLNQDLKSTLNFGNYKNKIIDDYFVYNTSPNSLQKNYMDNLNIKGQWFFSSCAMSFDHESFYVNTVINNKDNFALKSFKKEKMFNDNIYFNDYHFRINFNNNKKMIVYFKNFGQLSSNIFIKNLIIFKEYLPYDFHYMYFDFTSISTSDFPELLYILPLNELIISGNSYSIKGNDILRKKIDTISIYLQNESFNGYAPPNFKHLYLLTQNTYYTNINNDPLKNETFRLSNSIINYYDDKPLKCSSSYYMNQNKICTKTCEYDSLNYTFYPGFNDRNFCDYFCTSSMNCNLNILSYTNDFCINSNDIYNLYYKCVDKSKNYYLQFSGFYNSENINIIFEEPYLTSYIIEFWYYPDIFLQATKGSYFSYSIEHYIFHSNSISIFLYLDTGFFQSSYGSSSSRINFRHYYKREWNKFVIYCLKNPDNGKYHIKAFLNNFINEPYDLGITGVDQSLTKILFCNKCTINSEIVNWGTGYYKNLIIWDGNKSNFPLTIFYESLFKNELINSIINFYPLSNEYISNNIIKDISNNKNIDLGNSIYNSNFRFQKINFSSKFDYIQTAIPSLGKFLNSFSNGLNTGICNEGCKRCWEEDFCYECYPDYFLNYHKCLLKKNYFFYTNYEGKDKDIKLEYIINDSDYDNSKNGFTVTFWIKIINLKEDGEIISYGKNNYLNYESDEREFNNKKFGLSLIYHEDNNNKIVILNDITFREKIGKWTFISLSYYEEKKDTLTFFPRLIKFEIDQNGIEILTNEKKLYINQFKIGKNFSGLLYSLKYFNNFIIGSFGFELNNGNMITPFMKPNQISKTYFPMGTTDKNCYQYNYFIPNENRFYCIPDYEKKLISKINSFDYYFAEGITDSIKCNDKCFNACYEKSENDCTCLNKNNNSQMLIYNNGNYYCKTFDYINFAKAKDITINNIKTGKFTKKFTLQFWIYPIEYTKNSFTGITFNWNGHLKIKVNQEFDSNINDNLYYFHCYYYDQNLIETGEIKTTISINEWNFLSCAFDYIDKYFYLNTNEVLIQNQIPNTIILNDIIKENDYTTLTIKDNSNREEWGLLFYRQIRLWNDAFFNAEFLSRIKIETPSLFPKLIHCYEPNFKNKKKTEFNNNFIVKDINEVGENIIIEKIETYGKNTINEINDIDLCNENGEFYDKSLKKCFQFTDISKMNDFSFSNIPPSYSGSYTMAFWIFFEDTTTISNGIHLIWEKHLQISIIKTNNLVGYCFPQGYYSDSLSNDNINLKYENSFNKGKVDLLKENQVDNGNWIFVICSVSNYNEIFYIKGNKDETEILNLKKEILYSYQGINYESDKLLRYYMSDVKNKVSKKTNLYLENITNNKKIYFRSIQLFRDYLPYKMYFQYVDLSQFDEKTIFPQLLFVVNFANFNFITKKLTYQVFNPQTVSTPNRKYTKIEYSISLKFPLESTFELSSNFIFLPLCPLRNKYDINNNICLLNSISCNNGEVCSDENNPIVCKNNFFLNIKNDQSVYCSSKCENNKMRTPGNHEILPICNSNIPENNILNTNFDGKNLNVNFCDQNEYFQIDYKCKKNPLISALFYSRCYNPPNFTFLITTSIQNNFINGYFFEIWIKLENVLNTCSRTYSKEYLLYANPNSIYLNTEDNNFYYNIIGTIYTKMINGISLHEWNKILIKVTLNPSIGQNVYIYINNNLNPEPIINNIEESINMQLQSISFCSFGINGQCSISGSPLINWGSAYYKNIKVWEINSSSFETIQIANSKYLKNYLNSLKLFYPLTFDYFDKNIILSGFNENNIIVDHIASNNFDTNDNFLFYNYEINFDWIENNKKNYISNMINTEIIPEKCHENCIRCYSSLNTYCYECEENYVLIGQKCTLITGYFLTSFKEEEIEFNISNIAKPLTEFTISFYIKFIGVIKPENSIEDKYQIMIFNNDFFISYKISNNALTMSLFGNVDKFIDYNFNNYLGTWVHVSISNYKSANNNIFPHMINLMVNKIDIIPEIDFKMHNNGAELLFLRIGNSIISYFADLKIYSKFHYGIFGHIKSNNYLENLILEYNLIGNSINNCIKENEIINSNFECVPDYNPYLENDSNCNNNDQYFDLSMFNSGRPCKNCNSICKSECFQSSELDCNCDLSKGIYWLRRNKIDKKTYCENIPYIDFSLFEPFIINVPSSITKESTIEMWVFIYSYNTQINNFDYLTIEWDYHNKISIKNINNILTLFCYSYYLSSDTNGDFNEFLSKNIHTYQWVYIKCGSDLIYNTFFLDDISNTINLENIPERPNETTLKISSGNPIIDYGFIFIRNIKLWQQYNFNYIDSQYFNLNSHGKYDSSIRKSNNFYPGLLTYIKGDLSLNDYEKTKEGKYTLYNLIGDDNTNIKYTINLNRRNTFKNYNYIDSENNNLYSLLNICDEGYYYNKGTSTCVSTFSSKCKFVSDSNDNCLTCPEEKKYLNPENGNCESKCPFFSYSNDYINQCRKCHYTCYTCKDEKINSCLSCIDPRFLLIKENICVENCEIYDLTSSKLNGNECVEFIAEITLINVSENVPIDIKNFNYLEVNVECNKDIYGILWKFNEEKTKEINGDDDMIFPFSSPFISDIHSLKVDVNNDFFEMGKKYVFEFEVYRDNEEGRVSISKEFILVMNSPPYNGKLIVFPEIGLLDFTVFIISSINWLDDSTDNLLYYFYYIEDKTNTIKNITNSFQSEIELMSTFIFIYPEESNYITIYCEIKDNYDEKTIVSQRILIVKDYSSNIYTIKNAFSNYYIPNNPNIEHLYRRSEFLKSLGLNQNDNNGEYYMTYFEPSLSENKINIFDPVCNTKYCNNRGNCDLIDKYMICICNDEFIGINCHFEKNYFDEVDEKFNELYKLFFEKIKDTINSYQLKIAYNLFFSASKFYKNSDFFNSYLDKFLILSMNIFTDTILENLNIYFDLIDFYYSLEFYLMNKLKLENKIKNNSQRNETLTEKQMEKFKLSFEYLSNKISSFLKYIMKQNKLNSFNYESNNFYLSSILISPSFNEENYFLTRKSKYKSQIYFRKCLNYIETKILGNSYFQVYLIFIEYYNYPYAYDNILYYNNTSPLIDVSFIDFDTAKDISLNGCIENDNIIIKLPFNSYIWLDELNRQYDLHNPNNYYNFDDPIFKDPVHINSSGFVFNESIKEIYEKYNRLYNFSCTFYSKNSFIEDGIFYNNLSESFIEFNSTHLSQFTTFFKENNQKYKLNNRFFYIKKPQLLHWFPNYKSNYAFIILGILFLICIFLIIIFTLYDNKYYKKETLLEFLKIEIVKTFCLYDLNKENEIKNLIPSGFDPGIKIKEDNEEKKEKKFEINLEEEMKRKDILNINIFNESDSNDSNINEIKIVKNKKKHNSNFIFTDDKSSERKLKSKNKNIKNDSIIINKKNSIIKLNNEVEKKINDKNMNNIINNLPENFEDEKEEYMNRLYDFQYLEISTYNFISINLKQRHLFLSSILNISLFNPRWKKLSLVITQIYLYSLLISIFLTAFEIITEKKMFLCILISILSILISNILMYIIIKFFEFSYKQRKRLFTVVIKGGQIVILKEWEKINEDNFCFILIGFLLIFGICFFSFYISFCFNCVWKQQNIAYLLCVFFSCGIDFIIFEVLIELFIGLLFYFRKVKCINKIAEFLNFLRNYRCLWP